MRVAAIDVGTNTIRLLVVETQGTERYRELDRRLRFTRLGEGVDASRRLQGQAMKRTLAAVAEFLAVCGEFGVEEITIAGTSALRDAANKDEFLDSVARLAAISPVVLAGDEEARLSFRGATESLPDSLYLVCDIGGGSTEFVAGWRDDPGKLKSVSLDLGAVRLTERFLLSNPPAPEEMLTMEAAIDEMLPAADSVFPGEEAEFVGVAGTVTTLAGIYLGLHEYDPLQTHTLELEREAVEGMYLELAAMTSEERSAVPLMPQGRADIIVAGVSILVRVMTRWSFDEVVVSERDILDGLVLEILGDERG